MCCIPFHPSDLGPSLCQRLVCVLYRMACSPPRAMHGRFRFTAACKSHSFLKPRSASKRHAPTHLIVALATCITKHTIKTSYTARHENPYAQVRFCKTCARPFNAVQGKVLTVGDSSRNPLTSPCSIEVRFRTSVRLLKIVRISLSSLEGVLLVPRRC